MRRNSKEDIITFRLKVCIGRLSVSPMCLFFGSLGLLKRSHWNMKSLCENKRFDHLEGVWAAKHLMKRAIVMTKPMPMRRTPYQ